MIHLDAHVDTYGPVAGIDVHAGAGFKIGLEEGLIDSCGRSRAHRPSAGTRCSAGRRSASSGGSRAGCLRPVRSRRWGSDRGRWECSDRHSRQHLVRDGARTVAGQIEVGMVGQVDDRVLVGAGE